MTSAVPTSYHLRLCALAFFSVFPLLNSTMSASADNIKQAWSAIIGENVLRQNITAIRDAAAKMPLAVRYQYLSRQVLPNGSGSNLRLAIDFAPTSSSATRDVDASAPLLNCGEPLVSPALDLIETATELNKLADLRNTVERITAASPAERIQQAAFLALLAISERDFATANKQLQQVFELTQSTPLTAAEPGAETLAVSPPRGTPKLEGPRGSSFICCTNKHSETVDRAANAGIDIFIR
jgi:hypothetical protein